MDVREGMRVTALVRLVTPGNWSGSSGVLPTQHRVPQIG